MKIKLTDGKVLAAAAVSMKGGGEQFNGREGKTATLYHGLWFHSTCVLPVLPHVISTVRRLSLANICNLFDCALRDSDKSLLAIEKSVGMRYFNERVIHNLGCVRRRYASRFTVARRRTIQWNGGRNSDFLI